MMPAVVKQNKAMKPLQEFLPDDFIVKVILFWPKLVPFDAIILIVRSVYPFLTQS